MFFSVKRSILLQQLLKHSTNCRALGDGSYSPLQLPIKLFK
jgi:hypothetical protein